MDQKMMLEAFGAVASIAAIDDAPPFKNAQTLMTDKRRRIVMLLSVISGKTPQEVLSQEAADSVSVLLKWLADGGDIFVRAIHSCGAEMVCTVLYEYRPEDVDALCFLLRRKRKDDTRVRYIADALRLLVMSKLEKGSRYPSLQDILEPKKAEPEKTGMDIMNDIFNAALGKKGEPK